MISPAGSAVPPVAPERRKRGPRKSTREALAAAEKRGYERGLADQDRAGEMLGIVGWMAICTAVGMALGAWWF
jgi:hypothetical protein